MWPNCIYVAYNLIKPGSDTNKTMSHPAFQNTKYGYVTMASRYSFHEYLRLSIRSRIAHIYMYTTKRRDKNTYMNYWNMNNIIHHIWIRQVMKWNWTHRRTTKLEYVLQSKLYTGFLISILKNNIGRSEEDQQEYMMGKEQ